jgi:iron(III) transport system substrate-binding protein
MEKRRSLYFFVACLCLASVLLPSVETYPAQLSKEMTADSISRGAKQEGKLSWSSNLEDPEVKDLHSAFQKEYPFIKINYKRVMGGEQRQRIISEMQSGLFPYDMMSIEAEAVDQFQKLNFLSDPVDWHRLFGVDPRMIHPQGFLVSIGNNPTGIYYNSTLVPKEHVPKTWADCTNPYFKGKLSMDVRPVGLTYLMYVYGEEWVLDFAKKLLANNPKWVRGNVLATTMVASGEHLISCVNGHGSWYRAAQGKTGYPVKFVFPEGPIVTGRELLLTPIRGAANPNAAILMTGWIASKGVKYLHTGRESILHPDTELGAQVRQMGREIKIVPWDMVIRSDELINKILQVWGFPKPERSGG